MNTLRISPAIIGTSVLACLVAASLLTVSLAAESPNIPSLTRIERSDWINVKSEVAPAAVGDGLADDTAALQAALNLFSEDAQGPKVVYLPAGTYRITSTLIWPSSVGCNLIGHGRDTVILWDGANDSRMMRTRGATQSRFDGITWNANNRNTIAVNHNADLRFEASPSHYNSAFLNASFGIQGNTGGGGTKASSEMLIENCLFENCGVGVDFSKSFNYYNEVILRCEFRNNGFGVTFGGGYGYVRFCHFENTTHFDIQGSVRSTARFCTSVNSGSFYNSFPALPGQTRKETRDPGTVQNCVVSGWTYDHAVSVTWNSLVFDNVFENPLQDIAPIYIYKDDAIFSENLSEDTTDLYAFAKYAGTDIVEIPAGNRTRLPLEATDSFLQSRRTVPTVIFDAVADFGAQPGTQNDDTAAVQATINAAAAHGEGAIAYFPSGRYGLSSPIQITGGNYVIGGTGYHSEFEWVGTTPGDVMFAINDPQDITVEHLGFHAFLMSDGCTAIQQTGTASSSITYTGLTMPGLTDVTNAQARLREGLHLKNLGAEASVYLGRVNGRARIEDCGQARILGELLNGTHPLIDGANHPHTGLTGFATMNTHDLVIDDNQSLVVGDLNLEQSAPSNQNGLRSIRLMKGAAANTSGRVTVGASKVNLFDSAQYFEVDNYEGQFSFLCGSPTPEQNRQRIELVQNGTAPLDLFIGAVDTSFVSMPILVDAGPSLTLTTLGNSHTRQVPDQWYGGGGTWITSPVAIDPNFVNFALQFDGIDDYLMGSVEGQFGIDNSALTAMTWLKPTSLGQDANLIGYMNYQNSQSKYTWYLRLNSDDTVSFVVKLKDTGATVSVRSTSTVTLNQWSHVAGSWDGATIRIYVDGIEEASAPALSTRLKADFDDRLLLGGSRGSSQVEYFYEGALDEARIYNQALSPAVIGNHFINSFGLPNEAGLVAGWHFNEGSNINFFDYNDPTGGYHLYSYEYGINHNPLDANMIAANALDHFRELYADLSAYNLPSLETLVEDPQGNPDGDASSNLIEYALHTDPDSGLAVFPDGTPGNGGFTIGKVAGSGASADGAATLNASYFIPAATDGLTYELQSYNVAASGTADDPYWVTVAIPANHLLITAGPAGSNKVEIQDLESVLGVSGAGSSANFRLKITLDEGDGNLVSDVTAVQGFTRRQINPIRETFSDPYNHPGLFTGTVSLPANGDGFTLDFTTSLGGDDLSAIFSESLRTNTDNYRYYAEVISGDEEGEIYDIESFTAGTITIANDTDLYADPVNSTHLGAVPATLDGDLIVIRKHKLFSEVHRPELLNSGDKNRTSSSAGFMIRSGGSSKLVQFSLLDGNSGNKEWTYGGVNYNEWVIPPSQGSMIHNSGQSGLQPFEILTFGNVRTNALNVPLKEGENLINSVFPVDQSPRSREMLASAGFTGGTNSRRTDFIENWVDDTIQPDSSGNFSTTNSWERSYLRKTSSLDQWSDTSTVTNRNDDFLFRADRSTIIRIYDRTNGDDSREDYVIPAQLAD